MNQVPWMYAVWATKQVSELCDTNHMMRYMGDVNIDKCLNYDCSPECSNHIPNCLDPGHTKFFKQMVEKLHLWLCQQKLSSADHLNM